MNNFGDAFQYQYFAMVDYATARHFREHGQNYEYLVDSRSAASWSVRARQCMGITEADYNFG